MFKIIFFLAVSSVVWCQKSEFYSDRDKAPPGVPITLTWNSQGDCSYTVKALDRNGDVTVVHEKAVSPSGTSRHYMTNDGPVEVTLWCDWTDEKGRQKTFKKTIKLKVNYTR